MTTADTYYFYNVPDWQIGSGRRLYIAMLAASVLIATALSIFQIQLVGDSNPISALVVHLTESTAKPDPPIAVEAVPRSIQAPQAEPLRGERQDTQPGNDTFQAVQPIQVMVARRTDSTSTDIETGIEPADVEDWHEFGAEVIRKIVANPEKQYTVNPPLDEKRRIAAIKFRPSEAPAKREIWDNVEKDQLGRTILRDGNRYRILDDPSAVNRDIFEKYEQYMVFFTIPFSKAPPKELPWVNEVREQYAYLRLREEQRRDPDAF